MNPERRATPREPLAVPIVLEDGSTAVTRNISAAGLFVLLPPGRVLDQWFSFEYDLPQAGLKFAATGEVVRTELAPAGVGVAVRLHDSHLVPL